MSIKLMSQVWEREIAGTAAMVLLCLADFAHDDGSRCFPAVKTVAHKVGTSDRQVQRVLTSLRRKGVLIVVGDLVGGRGHTTQYQIDLTPLKLKAKAPRDPFRVR